MPFSLSEYETDLQPLFDAAQGLFPGMIGTFGGHKEPYVSPGLINRPVLERLVSEIRDRTPEAGRGYWSLRSWSLLVWQPVVLAVLSVHKFGMVPRIDLTSQRVVGDAVMGYRLPSRTTLSGPAGMLIEPAGKLIKALADDLLSDLSEVIPVKPLLARRLLADRMLGVLAQIARTDARFENYEVQRLAREWLKAASLEGQSALMEIELPSGMKTMVLARRACCLEYRTAGAGYCPSCPKQPLETRKSRLTAFWAAKL